MGKSWKRNSRNDGWRRAKMDRERQKNGGRKPEFDKPEQEEKFSPFDLPPEEHEKFA